ncbi:MAG TPA: hypothetical protein VIL29_11500 [Pseudothermotoga sp.]|uniref:hypothetical protein n=1 Tax=Thermotoga profunda TaxID=1508420 RepID=UPI000596B7D8|nr:hypothetical protein [Thermotoga profunda]
MLTIGILGTAKNTGKTTALNAVLKCLNNKNLAITSIGFDGEDLDHVTGLPKPKVIVDEGTLVITSEEAARHSTAKMELLERLSLKTPMGSISVYRVKELGTVVLVGPNSSDDLFSVLKKLQSYELDFLVVDGAINRMVPFQYVDYVIIATGAARTINLNELVAEARLMVKAFLLPKADDKNRVSLPGFVSVEKLQSNSDKSLLVESPIHLILADNYKKLEELLEKMDIAVKRKPELLCVTINPCYPERRVEGYQLSKIDISEVVTKLKEELDVVCIDVNKEENILCDFLAKL